MLSLRLGQPRKASPFLEPLPRHHSHSAPSPFFLSRLTLVGMPRPLAGRHPSCWAPAESACWRPHPATSSDWTLETPAPNSSPSASARPHQHLKKEHQNKCELVLFCVFSLATRMRFYFTCSLVLLLPLVAVPYSLLFSISHLLVQWLPVLCWWVCAQIYPLP